MSRSPGEGPARRSPRERTAQIEAAARALALDAGLAAVTLRAVAKRVGVASGLVARYAPSMDALVASTFQGIVETEIAEVRQLLASESSPAACVVALVDTLLDQSRDDVTVIWVEAWGIGRRNATLAPVVRQQMDAWRDIIQDIIERGTACGEFRDVDAESVAWLLLGMIDGLNAHALVRWNELGARGAHIRNALEGMLGTGATFG
ncbi:TetR family transcriptional regulator [Rhodoglobus vestalii]|uniref:TetR family transcriptional regulator n=1 Tax=Rhodoglobus vestalii TaxID=193384 RepID=A0A8H2PYE4_9MICO|nr:TetR family transcriptional regulator C-terminal domain-containing protein [Rhodoglobus vestalii]TQO20274.1 TetR family transcriptional regulator [Rhodoglobus vestalii]